MTPQEWIDATQRRFPGGCHTAEGAQHLASALKEIARLQAQLSQAERVVVPELTDGIVSELWEEHSTIAGKREKASFAEGCHATNRWFLRNLNPQAYREIISEIRDEFLCDGVICDGAALRCEAVRRASRAHSVPASRVLKDGEVAVQESLLRAGQTLSNIAFNMKQLDTIPEDWRAKLKSSQEAWDALRAQGKEGKA